MSNEIKKVNESNEIVGKQEENVIYGFEDSKNEDLIIPRIKVVQALSPERIDGECEEGNVINDLSKEDVSEKKFVPLKQYYSNIWWNEDRDAEDRIICRSVDGRIGVEADGTTLVCAQCKKNQWDNTKKGKDAQPVCTAYLNFLGFFEDTPMPVVLSFAKTNYKEGKKMLSIARSLRSSLWNYSYTLTSKKITKGRNTWYIMVPNLATETSPEVRALAFELYKGHNDMIQDVNYEDSAAYTATSDIDKDVESELI